MEEKLGDNGDKLTGAEKPVLETGGTQEVKPKEEIKKEIPQPTDFKIAEIWLRQGRVFIDAHEEFWKDKCRALGLLEYCKDIVKEARPSEPKIIPARGGMVNFARNIFGRKR
jgi:hypothetical protein